MFSGLFTMIMVMVVVSIIVSMTSRRSAPPPPQVHGWGDPYALPQGGYQQPYGHPVYPISPGARAALDEDITTFGGELRDLDLDVVGRELDAAAQADYTRALDAYDGSKNQLQRAQTDADVRRIAEVIEPYAAGVPARVAARSIFAATHIFLVQPSLGLGHDAAGLRAQIAQIIAGARTEAHTHAATPPRRHESAHEGGTPPEGEHHE